MDAENKQKKPRNKKRTITTVGVIVAILVVAGAGFMVWHEQPSFCAAICHNMDPYYETYVEDQGTTGKDKYGNEVANTNAMMATMHRVNQTTAKGTITCLNCHEPTLAEQASEGIAWVSGNYLSPLTERQGSYITEWRSGMDSSNFCANENCHSYLVGNDGTVDRTKLEATTANREFNPHSTHHSSEMQCTTCHKGHRASVMECTACHEHENVAVPDGWLTAAQGAQIMEQSV